MMMKNVHHIAFSSWASGPPIVEEKLWRYVHILVIITELTSMKGKMQNCCVG
jgi:hypothetical protein